MKKRNHETKMINRSSKKSSKSVLSTIERQSKPVYLYDVVTKEYIFYSENQKKIAQVMGRTATGISRYTKGDFETDLLFQIKL